MRYSVISQLQHLSQIASGLSMEYELAAEIIDSPNLSQQLERRARARTMMRVEIDAIIRARGGDPAPPDFMPPPVSRAVAQGATQGDVATLFSQIARGETQLRDAMCDPCVELDDRVQRLVEALSREQEIGAVRYDRAQHPGPF